MADVFARRAEETFPIYPVGPSQSYPDYHGLRIERVDQQAGRDAERVACASGDLVIEGSGKFSDYRDQYISDAEFQKAAPEYCRQAGLPSASRQFVDHLHEWLSETARKVDVALPDNECLSIENGEPVLRKLDRQSTPDNLPLVSQMAREQIRPVNLVEALTDTETWLNWSRHFGPFSGHETKLDDPVFGYLMTVFTYGCNLRRFFKPPPKT